MLLLVRHAHAGDKRRWQGPDDLRPLSLAGQAEASGLVVRLEDYPIRRILTSPTLRCHQTLQPLAPDCHLRVEREVAFGVDAERARVQALLEDLRDQDAVVCTHGEVIEQVLTRLVADGLMVDQPLEWPKGRPGCWTGPTGDSRMPATCPHWPWAEARSAASGTWGEGSATSPRKVSWIDKYCSACTGARCSSVGGDAARLVGG
jgi:phosphohistidine phosphatase SixA